MTYLTREDILNVKDFVIEEVDVPEWGGKLRVKSLSGKERDRFEQSIMDIGSTTAKMNMENVRAKLVSVSVVDENNKLLFSPKDVMKLGDKNGKVLDRIFSVAQRLSGLSDENLEELSQNLKKDQRDNSISD